MNIINRNTVEHPNSRSSNMVLLDTSGTELATTYPNGVYAQLMYAVGAEVTLNAANLSSIEMNTDELEDNTAYQDTPFNDQVAVTTSAAQITANNFRGWVTLSVDPDTADVVYIGNSGVTTGNGYKLSSSNSSIVVSSDALSEWYVIGASGGETLYVLGAYFSG